ncbi:MAG: EutN/CcmL family microcompartment protein [Anaerolineales bacterium]|nr:EutN/CcmL family microcompartment protein [Anaerolineales bacterium]
MVIAKVVGTVVSTVKHPAYHGYKLQLVQPLNLPHEAPEEIFLVLDNAHAGIGDTVLVMREGGAARQIMQSDDAPVISMIVGILDSVDITG